MEKLEALQALETVLEIIIKDEKVIQFDKTNTVFNLVWIKQNLDKFENIK